MRVNQRSTTSRLKNHPYFFDSVISHRSSRVDIPILYRNKCSSSSEHEPSFFIRFCRFYSNLEIKSIKISIYVSVILESKGQKPRFRNDLIVTVVGMSHRVFANEFKILRDSGNRANEKSREKAYKIYIKDSRIGQESSCPRNLWSVARVYTPPCPLFFPESVYV